MDGSLQDLDSSAIHQREIQFWIKVQMRLNHVLKNDSPALESISEYERTKLMDELEYNEFQSMKQAKFCLGLPVGEGLPQGFSSIMIKQVAFASQQVTASSRPSAGYTTAGTGTEGITPQTSSASSYASSTYTSQPKECGFTSQQVTASSRPSAGYTFAGTATAGTTPQTSSASSYAPSTYNSQTSASFASSSYSSRSMQTPVSALSGEGRRAGSDYNGNFNSFPSVHQAHWTFGSIPPLLVGTLSHAVQDMRAAQEHFQEQNRNDTVKLMQTYQAQCSKESTFTNDFMDEARLGFISIFASRVNQDEVLGCPYLKFVGTIELICRRYEESSRISAADYHILSSLIRAVKTLLPARSKGMCFDPVFKATKVYDSRNVYDIRRDYCTFLRFAWLRIFPGTLPDEPQIIAPSAVREAANGTFAPYIDERILQQGKDQYPKFIFEFLFHKIKSISKPADGFPADDLEIEIPTSDWILDDLKKLFYNVLRLKPTEEQLELRAQKRRKDRDKATGGGDGQEQQPVKRRRPYMAKKRKRLFQQLQQSYQPHHHQQQLQPLPPHHHQQQLLQPLPPHHQQLQPLQPNRSNQEAIRLPLSSKPKLGLKLRENDKPSELVFSHEHHPTSNITNSGPPPLIFSEMDDIADIAKSFELSYGYINAEEERDPKTLLPICKPAPPTTSLSTYQNLKAVLSSSSSSASSNQFAGQVFDATENMKGNNETLNESKGSTNEKTAWEDLRSFMLTEM